MSGPGADDDLALFASFVRETEQAERDAKKAARQERRAAQEQNRLVEAKKAAAAEVKRLRSRGVSAEEKVAVDVGVVANK